MAIPITVQIRWRPDTDGSSSECSSIGEAAAPNKTWQSHRGCSDDGHLQLCATDRVEDLPSTPDTYRVIEIDFSVFNDGRGYSLARQLRTQHQYAGELRATGDIRIDQADMLARCGFDTLELPADTDMAQLEAAINAITVHYQADAQPGPSRTP
jgi:uncharacterized protein (DUF934 family)